MPDVISLRAAAREAGTSPQYLHALRLAARSPFPSAFKLDPYIPNSDILLVRAEFEAWLRSRNPRRQFWRGRRLT